MKTNIDKVEIMRKLFYVSSILLLLFALCFMQCGEDSTGIEISPVGTWEYSEITDQGTILMVIEVVDNKTYSANGFLTDGSITITLSSETGIWKIDDGTIEFFPGDCKEYDFNLMQIVSSDCGVMESYAFNGSSMTNGAVNFTRE